MFGENRLAFGEKCKIIKIWGMITIGQVQVLNRPAKTCAFRQKVKKTLKNFKKILRFFDQNLAGKLNFFTFFTKYFFDFWLLSQSIYLWKIKPDFYNNFSDFEVGWGSFQMFPHTGDAYGLGIYQNSLRKINENLRFLKKLSCICDFSLFEANFNRD